MKRIFSVIVLICIGFSTIAQQEVKIPDNLQATEIDDYSALLTWNKDDGIFKYILSYNVAMSENVIEIETFDTSYYINNLLSATQYLWKVRAISVDMDTSEWSNLSSFYTAGYNTDCAAVNHLTAYSFNEKNLAIGWKSDEDCLYWEIVCDEIGSNPDNIGKRYFTTNLEYIFDDLQAGQTYQFAVRSHCNGSYSNWNYIFANYTFDGELVSLPVEMNLNDDNSLNSLGLISSNTNSWVIGQPETENTADNSKVLYISNDNAQSATFNNKIKSNSYAYIDFYVPEESTGFYIDFAYKSSLVSEYDGMKVFLLSNGSDLDIDSLPEPVFQYGENIYNNTNGVWKDGHIDFPVDFTDSPRKIVFAWTNTDTCQSDSSILLKDIKITPRYCPIPDSLTAKNITYNSAEISWKLDDFQQSYNIQYKKSTDSIWNTIDSVYNNYIIDNLEDNTSYFYRVQANCTDEQSFYSDMYDFTTEMYLDIVDINTIEYTTSYNSAEFSWEDKQDVKFYRVKYKENVANTEWKTLETPTNSCVIDSLSAQTEYLFKVCIITMQNLESKYTDEIVFATVCAPITVFPYVLNDEMTYNSQDGFAFVASCYDTSFTALETPVFDISELATAEFGFDVASSNDVFMYISNDGGETYSFLDAYIPQSYSPNTYVNKSYILSDYIMDNNIKIRFLFNTDGSEDISAKIANITMKNTCTAPKSIDIDTIDYTFFTVSWNAGTMTTSWLVKLYDNSDSLIKSVSVSSPSCTFTQLEKNTLYKLVIKGNCSSLESYDSLLTYITTLNPNDGTCHIPANFKAYQFMAKGDETILAKWETVADEKIWEVWYKDVYAFQWNQKIVTIQPQFSIRNLNEGDKYEIKVRSVCAPGDTSDFTKTDTVEIKSSSLISVQENIEQIIVYPNPTKDFVTLDLQGKEADVKEVIIVNSVGQIVYRNSNISNNNANMTIDMTYLPVGNYILTCFVDDKKIVKQIIKQ